LDEPTHHIGYLSYSRNGVEEEVQFLYPSNIQWVSVRCGACCGDVGERERMIMLLDKETGLRPRARLISSKSGTRARSRQ